MDYRLIVVPAIACALLAWRPADAQELQLQRSRGGEGGCGQEPAGASVLLVD